MRSHAKAASASTTHGEDRRFSIGVIAAMLVCAAAFLGIGAPAASAAPSAEPGWVPKTSFHIGSTREFGTPRNAIATDSHGNVAVANANQLRLDLYSAEGASVLTSISNCCGFLDVAIDPSDDTIYASELEFFGGTAIRRYTSDGSPTPSYTLDPGFGVPIGDGFAVDPTTHDLLVADSGAEAVLRYEADGTLVDTISATGLAPAYVTVASDGSFYIASIGGSDVTHMAPGGTVLGTLAGVGPVEEALAWDPVNEVLTTSLGKPLPNNPIEGETKLKLYSPTGQLISESPAQNGTVSLAVDPVNDLLYQFTIGNIFVYAPGTQAGVEPPSVTEVEAHSAHVTAEVDPGEGPPAGSEAHFEYSLAGSENWQSTPSQELTTAGVTEVEANLTGLLARSEYLVRVAATNSGLSKTSSAVPFSTPEVAPEVTSANATDVTETSAVLNGGINPNGLPTSYYFEYGTTTGYGSRIPVAIDAVAGAGSTPKAFGRTIFDLTPGTTYHFRLVATSSAGTTEGADRTFTTAGVGGVLLREYEQVTPAIKEGANVYRRVGFQAAPDGNALAYVTQVNEASAPVFARSISLRGSTDWQGGIDVDPPASLGSVVRDHETLAISDDFTHALVVSNQALTPGGIDGAANLYLEDIAARTYRFVGVSTTTFAFPLLTGIQTTGLFQAGSANFDWMVFASPVPLLSGAPKNAIYRWTEADGLEVESVLPNGDPSPGLRANYASAYRTVSADGSRIYYTALKGAEEGVFLREAGGPPKAIAVDTGPGEVPDPPILLGISKDGRYAFIFSEEKLTSDAPDSENEVDRLYRYDADDDSFEYLGANGPPHFMIRDENGDGVKIMYGSFGISDSGDTIYFTAPDGSSLKVWRKGVVHSVTSTFIGWGYEHFSPNGRYFVYNSNGAGAGGAVRLYDAENNETSCASCLPDGTPVDATLPWQGDSPLGSRRPLAVDDSGTVYFDTAGRLVAKDVNAVEDVYSYRDGAATLISPGNAPYSAYISDVTPDGRNVFFTTGQKLVGRDNDEEVDVYDARVNGGLPAQSPPPPQECLRDDCKATPNAGPELPFGGSEALSGPENVKPVKHKKCGKGKRAKKAKGKVRCVKKSKAGHKHKASKNKKGGNR